MSALIQELGQPDWLSDNDKHWYAFVIVRPARVERARHRAGGLP
jgi:hypothetical protein